MKIKLTKKLSIDSVSLLIVIAIVVLVVYFSFFRDNNQPGPGKEITQCIASKSVIYISTGCHACEAQEKLFGDDFRYLDIVDCFIEGEKCGRENVTRVPIWIINGNRYSGVQPIEKLINLTGCGQ